MIASPFTLSPVFVRGKLKQMILPASHSFQRLHCLRSACERGVITPPIVVGKIFKFNFATPFIAQLINQFEQILE